MRYAVSKATGDPMSYMTIINETTKKHDYRDRTRLFNNKLARDVIPYKYKETIVNKDLLLPTLYDRDGQNGGKYYSYEYLSTSGFYSLSKAVYETKQPTKIFMMVSNANAPRPLYHADEDDLSSIFMYNDNELFGNSEELAKVKAFENNLGVFTWNYLMLANLKWWATNNGNYIINLYGKNKKKENEEKKKESSLIMNELLGFTNPYEKVTILFGKRRNDNFWSDVENDQDKDHWFILGLPTGIRTDYPDPNKPFGTKNSIFISKDDEQQWKTWRYRYYTTNTKKKDLLDEIINQIKASPKMDKQHICPLNKWESKDRLSSKAMCKYNLN